MLDGDDDARVAGSGRARAACGARTRPARRGGSDRGGSRVTESTRQGSRVDAWVPMADGIRLSVTLYLPDPAGGPQPCILEALPYRKDDMTSTSYSSEYERLRDEYGYAVARLDLRGTGSSGGRATDEYPAQEQADLHEVIAWLAAQDWCSGAVGMYGTSYSGFNALQMACERPSALKAICAIYATDDRYTDDVHYLGGVLKWLDLVDYCHYMTPMNALPPVPAIWGEGWREEWLARIEEHEPWLFTWLENASDGAYWRHGSVRSGLRPHRVPDDDRRGLGGRLPQQLVPHDGGVGAQRRPASAARGSVGARVAERLCSRPAHRPGAGDGPLVGPLVAWGRQRHRLRARSPLVRPRLAPTRPGPRHWCLATGGRRSGLRHGRGPAPSSCSGVGRTPCARMSARPPGSPVRATCPTASRSTNGTTTRTRSLGSSTRTRPRSRATRCCTCGSPPTDRRLRWPSSSATSSSTAPRP